MSKRTVEQCQNMSDKMVAVWLKRRKTGEDKKIAKKISKTVRARIKNSERR
jgi:hypothetical protein